MSVEISKKQVEDNFKSMCAKLDMTPVPFEVSPFAVQIHWLFSAAYVVDYRPEEMMLLVDALELLKDKGYYYTKD